MSDGPSFWLLLLLLVLGLWMLGAYNRVTALRAAILTAWGQVDAALAARGRALAELLALADEPLSAERTALEMVGNALTQLAAAIDAARRRPAHHEPVAALAKADAVLVAFSVRLLALVEHDSALRGHAAAQTTLAALRESQPQLAFARQTFNAAGQRYNEALQQFPTRLLVPVFRLEPAGQL